MRFVDCNCAVGLPVAAQGFRVYDPDGIERILRRCGITAAYAHHNAAYDLHPVNGNGAIDALCAENSFFKPVWVVMPNDTGEFYDPAALIRRMSEGNVSMVRMFPRYNDHSFSLSQWCAGSLLDALEVAGIPLLLDEGQVSWDEVHGILAAYPGLPVIITNLYYRHGRVIASLLKRHKNLYCETSGLRSFDLLEALCGQAGADRLVFGTGMGTYSAGSAVALLTYAGISQAEKEAIAYGNLSRLLKRGCL